MTGDQVFGAGVRKMDMRRLTALICCVSNYASAINRFANNQRLGQQKTGDVTE